MIVKKKLYILGAGVCICVVIYVFLVNSLMTRFSINHKGYNTMSTQHITTHQRLNTLCTLKKNVPFSTHITTHQRLNTLCTLKKNVPFSTITRNQASKDEKRTILPEESLEKLVHFNSCAVVSSSHALRLHTYGQEIDSRDAVLRFNCAPTHTFEQFVGNRTDIRLINTRIPERACKEEFWGEKSTIFKHGYIVIRNMNAINLEGLKIDSKHDRFHGFANWIKYSKKYPNRTLPFIQRPEFGNGILAELTRFCNTTQMCTTKLRPSLSSGLLGVVMMMHLCDWVHVYELVPSDRDDSKLNYYYDEKRTKGVWHPYGAERAYVRTLSLTPEKDINDTGVVLLKGFSQTQCG